MFVKSQDIVAYLQPEIVTKIKNLELRAKAVVEGFMVGLHRSPYHGFSVEFSQHRPYMQGDSLRDVDWKVYAKSDRFYIKQYEEETNLICNLFLDVSNSMSFKHKASVTKLDYAVTLASALSYIMINQKDAVALTIYSNEIQNYLPPKSNRLHLKNILISLAGVKPGGTTNTTDCLNKATEKIKKRGLTIIISDFFDDADTILKSIKKIKHRKNEVILFHLLDPSEIDFDFEKDALFVDLETSEELSSQPYHIRKAYSESMAGFIEKLKNESLNYGIEYNLIKTNENFSTALFSYFKKRIMSF
ncbi:DUF58 domain-containing protein [Melioribacter sp. Ez-97]|uniref:DUF58 domain-containing protein n=1 Tax=Melioribacter sp. Ez-97 TaxID=3423434 RepID=UPI003EDAD5CE